MNRRIYKKLLLLGAAVGMMFSVPMTVSAQATELDGGTDAAPIREETPAENEATPFSLAGNGELVDDKSDDDTKEFFTIQTKNNNTFFLILDRSGTTENVYMLSMIDENDLAEFLEEEKTEEEAAVILEEPETELESEEPEAEPEKKTGSVNMAVLLAVAAFLVGGAGGYYYLKVLKPKKNEKESEDEDLEFYDGGAYINEDGEDDPEQEEE